MRADQCRHWENAVDPTVTVTRADGTTYQVKGTKKAIREAATLFS